MSRRKRQTPEAELATVADRIRLEIANGELEEAERLLAEANLEDEAVASELRSELDRARPEADDLESQQRELLARARSLIQAGRFRAACEEIRSSPEELRSAQSRELLEETEAQLEDEQEGEERRPEAVTETATAAEAEERALAVEAATSVIEDYIRGQELGPAETVVINLEQRYGKDPAIDGLRERVEAERAGLRERHISTQLEEIEGYVTQGQLDVAADELRVLLKLAGEHGDVKARLNEVETTLAENERSDARAAEAAQQIGRLLDSGGGAAREPKDAPAAPREPTAATRAVTQAPTAPRPRLPVAAIAVLGVLVVALAIWLLRGSGGEVDTADPSAETESTVSLAPTEGVAPVLGAATIDARPWAEILEIVDSAGTSMPLPQPPYTPALLRLPPGRYTVSLRYPQPTGEDGESPNRSEDDAGSAEEAGPQALEIEVIAGEPTSYAVELETLAADDYFDLLGW